MTGGEVFADTVVVVRCTQKLLRRLRDWAWVESESTTVLGDWCGNLVVTRNARLLLFISERSRLPVLLPARNLAGLATNFPTAVSNVLVGLSVPALSISRELEAMAEVRFVPTNSRSLLASLNDFTFHLKWRLQTDTGVDLQSLALELSEVPSGPLGYQQPGEVTRGLFVGA